MLITELNKTPLNWYAGAWFDLTVSDGASTKGHLIYDDANANHGYTKNLYYSDTPNIDLVFLQSACISNILLQDKLSIINKANNEKIVHEKIIQTQEDQLKLERDQNKALEMQVAAEAKKMREKNEAIERDRLYQLEQARSLKVPRKY